MGLEANALIGYVTGWQNSKSIELSSSDDPTRNGWLVPWECNIDTHMHDPNVVGIVNAERRRYDSQEVSVFRCE